MTNILNVKNLEKTYKSGEKELKVLDNISFSIQTGETFAIVGPSGSGKTFLVRTWLSENNDVHDIATSASEFIDSGQ